MAERDEVLQAERFEGVRDLLVLRAAGAHAVHRKDEGLIEAAVQGGAPGMRGVVVHEANLGFAEAVRTEAVEIEEVGKESPAVACLGKELHHPHGDVLTATESGPASAVPPFGELGEP